MNILVKSYLIMADKTTRVAAAAVSAISATAQARTAAAAVEVPLIEIIIRYGINSLTSAKVIYKYKLNECVSRNKQINLMMTFYPCLREDDEDYDRGVH